MPRKGKKAAGAAASAAVVSSAHDAGGGAGGLKATSSVLTDVDVVARELLVDEQNQRLFKENNIVNARELYVYWSSLAPDFNKCLDAAELATKKGKALYVLFLVTKKGLEALCLPVDPADVKEVLDGRVGLTATIQKILPHALIPRREKEIKAYLDGQWATYINDLKKAFCPVIFPGCSDKALFEKTHVVNARELSRAHPGLIGTIIESVKGRYAYFLATPSLKVPGGVGGVFIYVLKEVADRIVNGCFLLNELRDFLLGSLEAQKKSSVRLPELVPIQDAIDFLSSKAWDKHMGKLIAELAEGVAGEKPAAGGAGLAAEEGSPVSASSDGSDVTALTLMDEPHTVAAAENAELRAQIVKLRESIEQLKAACVMQELRVVSLAADVTKRDAENAMLRELVTQSAARVTAFEKEGLLAVALKTENDKLKMQIVNLQALIKRLEAREAERVKLESAAKATEAALAKAREDLARIEADKKALEKQIAVQQAVHKAALAKVEGVHRADTMRIARLEELVAAGVTKAADLTAALAASEAGKDAGASELAALHAALAAARAEAAALKATNAALQSDRVKNLVFRSLVNASIVTPALRVYLTEPYREKGRAANPVIIRFLQALRDVYVRIGHSFNPLKNQCQSLASVFLSDEEWRAYAPAPVPEDMSLIDFYNRALCDCAEALGAGDLLKTLLSHFAYCPLPMTEMTSPVTHNDVKLLEGEVFSHFRAHNFLPTLSGAMNLNLAMASDIDLVLVGEGTAKEAFLRFIAIMPEWMKGSIDLVHQQIRCEREVLTPMGTTKIQKIDITIVGNADPAKTVVQSSRTKVINVAAACVTDEGQAFIDLAIFATVLDKKFVLIDPGKTRAALEICKARILDGSVEKEGATAVQSDAHRHICLILKHISRFRALGYEIAPDAMAVCTGIRDLGRPLSKEMEDLCASIDGGHAAVAVTPVRGVMATAAAAAAAVASPA